MIHCIFKLVTVYIQINMQCFISSSLVIAGHGCDIPAGHRNSPVQSTRASLHGHGSHARVLPEGDRHQVWAWWGHDLQHGVCYQVQCEEAEEVRTVNFYLCACNPKAAIY